MADIQKIVKDTVSEAICELKKQGLIVSPRYNAFQKTEQLLYNYCNFKNVVQEKYKYIEHLKEVGMPKKSTSIIPFTGNNHSGPVSEDDKIDEQVASIEKSIAITKRYIKVIEDALSQITDDRYYEVIPLRYFEGKTREEIADYFGVDVKTVSRNKNRLVNILKIFLFSDEVIIEIFS